MVSENEEKKPEATVELSVDDLEDAAGGYVLDKGDYGGSFPYVVVDDKTGEKGTSCNVLGSAQWIAKANGFSDEVISPDQYKQIFGKEY